MGFKGYPNIYVFIHFITNPTLSPMAQHRRNLSFFQALGSDGSVNLKAANNLRVQLACFMLGQGWLGLGKLLDVATSKILSKKLFDSNCCDSSLACCGNLDCHRQDLAQYLF